MRKSQRIYLPIKRLIGFFGSIIGIIVCFVFLWWWVFPVNVIVTKGHPFFLQERYGREKKTFKMIKFRSMKLDANPNLAPSGMDKITQSNMYTGFGKFLRKTSIDETPQLLNIFIGQMAFIGPRPGSAHNEEDLVIEREKYNPNAFIVKPGLSGYAQVKMGRSHNPAEKARYDHEYVDKISFWFDCRVFLLTCLKIFSSVKGS